MNILRHLGNVLLLCSFIMLGATYSYAQKSLEEHLKDGNTFPQKTQNAEAYFARKHPLLQSRQLTAGEHRDGEFVKYMRWKHFWKSRLNPDGTLGDPTAYFQRKQSQPRSSSAFAAVEWRNIGLPKNIGGQIGVGRTTAVEFHPSDVNTFWVATAIGGIWKTQDGGKTYFPIGDNMVTLAVSDILVDKTNPDIIYAATGDRIWYGLHGVGVVKSLDGGQSWQGTSLNWAFSNFDRIYALEADPTDPNVVYAATDAGFYKTTDGFNTVSRINQNKSYDVRFKPGDPSVLYYTAGNAFYKSTDGGASFSQTKTVISPQMMRITVSPADPDRVYFSNRNDLYQSYDSGQSFNSEKDISELDNGTFGYVIMSPQNADILYGGYFNTWKTIDNGSLWKRITCFSGGNEVHVDNHFAAFNPLDPTSVFFCNDGGLYKFRENPCGNCEDCFPIYEDLSGGMLISQYYDISNSQQTYNLISGGTQDNGSFFRSAGGQWQFYAPTADGMVGAIDPTDDNYHYWAIQNGTIYRYENGGSVCISCNIPNNESGNGAWVTPYQLDPQNPSIIVAGFKRIYRSTNRGNTWTAVSDGLATGSTIDLLAIPPSNTTSVYAVHVGSSSLFKGINIDQASASWTTMNLPFYPATSVAVDPKNENRIFITVGDFNPSEKVYRSEDGGNTWTNISGTLPNVPVNVIKILDDPAYDDAMFIGTDAGVFFRDASMNDWEEYGELAHTNVRDIEFQYTNKLIRIGTHGRSVYEAFLSDNICLSDNPPDADQDGVCDAIDACPDGDDLQDEDNDGKPDACETFCSASGADGTGSDYITLVNLHTLTNRTGKTPYSDFTNLSTTLEAGESYTLEVGLQFSFDLDAAYGWIDFNQNKDFDPEELIEMSAFNSSHISQGTFTVPEDAKGGTTVLRVRNIYAEPQFEAPCDSYFGEVEDYSVEIVGVATNVPNKLNSALEVEIFPNPSSGDIEIKLEGFQIGTLAVEISNIQGQVVMEQEMLVKSGIKQYALKTSNLPSGIYGLNIRQNGLSISKKLIKY